MSSGLGRVGAPVEHILHDAIAERIQALADVLRRALRRHQRLDNCPLLGD
ncbi:hypothetical protein [Mesorhizobium sp. M0674]